MKLTLRNAMWSGLCGLLLLAGNGLAAADFPEGLKAVKIATAHNGWCTFAIADDGQLYTWGYRIPGTPLIDDEYYVEKPALVPRPGFIQKWDEISVGSDHVLAIVNGGDIVAWGYNFAGQVGVGTTHEFFDFVPITLLAKPAGVTRWLSVAATGASSCALADDGRLFVWGLDAWVELVANNLGNSYVSAPTPRPMPAGVSRWSKIFPKAPFYALADNGELYHWPTRAGLDLIPKPEGLDQWLEVASGANHTIALDEAGRLYAWGMNYNGALGVPGVVSTEIPIKVALPEGVNACRAIAAGAGSWANSFSGAIADDGRFLVWGAAGFGYMPVTANEKVEVVGRTFDTPTILSFSAAKLDWVELEAGRQHFAALDVDGKVFTWGEQFDGGWNCAPSAQSPFGRPAVWARYQRIPSPVAGFGRPYDAPAEQVSVSMSGIEEGMIVVEGEPLDLLLDIVDPMGAASLERLRVGGRNQFLETDGIQYPVTRSLTGLAPGSAFVNFKAVLWNGVSCIGPGWGYSYDSVYGPSVQSPLFHVVPNDDFDPLLPVVGVTAVGEKLIEGHDQVVELLFARAGDLSQPLELHLESSGATLGVDYSLSPAKIRFEPGERVVRVTVSPRWDLVEEGVEVATVGIADSPAYQVSSLRSVSFSIFDNQKPFALITQPFEQETLLVGNTSEVVVSAADPDGALQFVLLHVDGNPVYAEALNPTNRYVFRWPWTPMAEGSHTLLAEVVDDSGERSYSNEVTVQVRAQPGPLDMVKLSAGYLNNACLRVPDGRWFAWGNNYSNMLNLDLERGLFQGPEPLPQPVVSPTDGGTWEDIYPSIWASAGVTAGGALRLFGDLTGLAPNGPRPYDLERDGGLDIPDDVTGWLDWYGGYGRYEGLADNHRVYQFVWSGGTVSVNERVPPLGAGGVLDRFGFLDTEGVVRIPAPFYLTPVNFSGMRGRRVLRSSFGSADGVYFVLTEDGQLWQRGGDEWFGNTNEATPTDGGYAAVRRITNPPEVAGWRDILAGYDFLLAWTLDGRLFVWGANRYGQLGLGDFENRGALTELPFPAGVQRWLKLDNGAQFTLALGDNGRVYSWGANESGQLGLGHLRVVAQPTFIEWFGDLRQPWIEPRPNFPPYGLLSVFSNGGEILPSPYTLEVRVGDSDGRPVRVEFLQDDASLWVTTNVPPDGKINYYGLVELGGTWQFRVRVTDDDGAVGESEPVTFSHLNYADRVPTLYSVPLESDMFEGTSDPRGFVLYRDSRTNLSLTVPLVIGGTATAGEDYAPLPTEVTFAPGVATIVLPVTLYENGDGGLRETLTISPLVSDCQYAENPGPDCYRTLPFSNRVIRIMPRRALVTAEVLSLTAYEGGQTNALIRLHRSIVTDTELTVSFRTYGTVNVADDLDRFPDAFTFAPGQTGLDVPVRAVRDGLVEGYEHLTLELLDGDCTGGDQSSTCYELGPHLVTFSVGDKPGPDLPVLNLSVVDPVAVEGTANHGRIELVRTGKLQGTVYPRIDIGGTTTLGVDLPEALDPLLIYDRMTSWHWDLAPVGDGVAEGIEKLVVRLLPSDPAGGYLVGNTNEVEVLIVDPPSGVSDFAGTAVLIENVRLESGRVRLDVAGDIGVAFELEGSPDLNAWQPLGTYTNLTGRLSIETDAAAGNAVFYRLTPLGD